MHILCYGNVHYVTGDVHYVMVTYTGNYIINNIHSINSTCKVHYVTGDVHYVTGNVYYVMVTYIMLLVTYIMLW